MFPSVHIKCASQPTVSPVPGEIQNSLASERACMHAVHVSSHMHTHHTLSHTHTHIHTHNTDTNTHTCSNTHTYTQAHACSCMHTHIYIISNQSLCKSILKLNNGNNLIIMIMYSIKVLNCTLSVVNCMVCKLSQDF